MTAKIITVTDGSFLSIAKKMKDEGLISLEQYAGVLRRNKLRA